MITSDPVAALFAGLASPSKDGSLDFSGPVLEEQIAAAERKLGLRFPNSYHAFLRLFGAGMVHNYDIFGLPPQDDVWSDIVAMNQRLSRGVPAHYLQFTPALGEYCYYLDTSQMNASGECPVVVVGPDEAGEFVADSFVDFLRQAGAGFL